MGTKKRITRLISFTKNDTDVYEFLKTLDNASEYVIDLVRNNMQSDGVMNSDEYKEILERLDEIKDLIESKEFVENKTAQQPNNEMLKKKMTRALTTFFEED